jgi:hypothetical protein
MNNSNRGGKRKGAGRKAKGITKKVSLTLSEELWNEINSFDGTCADYIRSLKQNYNNFEISNLNNSILTDDKELNMNEVTPINKELTKEHIDEFWNIYKCNFLEEQPPEERVSDQAVEEAYTSLMDLFKGQETAQIQTSMRYRSPFTNKWFSSMQNLLRSEIPTLIIWADKGMKRKNENHLRKRKDAEIKRMSQETLARKLLS